MREVIKNYVLLVHADHTYGDKPYTYHLEGVWNLLRAAGLDSEEDEEIAYSHDAIEDAKNKEAARLFMQENLTTHGYRVVWAVTGIGPTRKERNACAYGKIAEYPESANYKVADRCINMKFSKPGSRHNLMYLKEAPEFYEKVVKLATNEYLIAEFKTLAGMD